MILYISDIYDIVCDISRHIAQEPNSQMKNYLFYFFFFLDDVVAGERESWQLAPKLSHNVSGGQKHISNKRILRGRYWPRESTKKSAEKSIIQKN